MGGSHADSLALVKMLKPNSLSILYGPERVGRPAKVCYVEP
jgi:hypothetical protein